MKKALPISFLLLVAVFFLIPSQVQAQTCPPLGTNVAANFDRENLELIANQANCSGPIPITVIITPVLVENPNLLLEIQNNLKEFNFDPTWRPWGSVDPNNTAEMQTWINAFNLLNIGQLQAWNEWNRYTEVSRIDPARDAQVIQALINAKRAGQISIPIGNTPLDLLNYTDMNYRDYWSKFNQACPNCLTQLDFIVSNVYAPSQYNPNSVNEFLQVWKGELDYLKSLGVNLSNKFFVISEAGLAPGAYTNFEQRKTDTILFAQTLEAAILKNPELFPDLSQITFLLMNDATGEQFLIYRVCDETGCYWKVDLYLVYNINVPGARSYRCKPEQIIPGDTTSRPVYPCSACYSFCDACNQTNLLTDSCAQAFKATRNVSYKHNEGAPCGGQHWVTKSWSGMVTIDPNSVTVPFAGKKEEEDEEKYLADYLEGTNELYKYYSKYWLDWVNHAGVFRKLTPMQYQNQLKKQMVERAKATLESEGRIQESAIHDYKVKYLGRICWDVPLLGDAFLALLHKVAEEADIPIPGLGRFISFVSEKASERTHYCVFDSVLARIIQVVLWDLNHHPLVPIRIAYRYWGGSEVPLSSLDTHLPPEPDEENYAENWDKWKTAEKRKWGNLWEVVPMFTREDTLDEITPYASLRPDDEFTLSETKAEFPHLARLYETADKIQKILLPKEGAALAENSNSQGFILAQACGLPDPAPVVDLCQKPALTDPNENDPICCDQIKGELTAKDKFVNEHYEECYRYQCDEEGICEWVFNASCNDTETKTVFREIGISLKEPYLGEIWRKTAGLPFGLFNIFRLYQTPEFPELDAASEIKYSFSPGKAEPEEGQFYFPYLGGVQIAKDWVVRSLFPY